MEENNEMMNQENQEINQETGTEMEIDSDAISTLAAAGVTASVTAVAGFKIGCDHTLKCVVELLNEKLQLDGNQKLDANVLKAELKARRKKKEKVPFWKRIGLQSPFYDKTKEPKKEEVTQEGKGKNNK